MREADRKMIKLVILNDLLAYFVIPSEELLYIEWESFSPKALSEAHFVS